MLLSDLIAICMSDLGIKKVFAFTGGSCARLIDSISLNEDLEYFCSLHEQADSMAADAYARISGETPAVVVTSGPGATNIVTGCAGAYYDSVPILFITGQVASGFLRDDVSVRQLGFQQTDIVSIVKPITKYAVCVDNIYDTIFEIEKAYSIANEGRKGPVLVDIPEDYQRTEINPEDFRHFLPGVDLKNSNQIDESINMLVSVIDNAKRPLFVIGQGVRRSRAEEEFLSAAYSLNIPAVFTFATRGIMGDEEELNYGFIGINGDNKANAALYNADLLICVGTRLDHHLIGKNKEHLSKDSHIVIVDIDEGEIRKHKTIGIDCLINLQMDSKAFFEDLQVQRISSKKAWELVYEDNQDYREQDSFLASFYDQMGDNLDNNCTIVIDTGLSLIWTNQFLKYKRGQNVISQFNHTAMGFAIPGAMGACLYDSNRQIVVISGDGGAQLNIQELATIKKHNMNIKMILFDNESYGLMYGAQNLHMAGRHAASSNMDGLSMPDLDDVVNKGYGIPTVSCSLVEDRYDFSALFEQEGPVAMIVKVPKEYHYV